MKIFQTITNSSINPFFFNRITGHISYAPSISIQNYSSYGYSNYVTPSLPSPIVSQPLFHSQAFSYQSSFSNLNSHPPIANSHSNNHYGQFYSSPIHQNFYSIPQILYYPTFHQIPTILTSQPANHPILQEGKAVSLKPTLKDPRQFSEVLTQTEPQYSKSTSSAQTQTEPRYSNSTSSAQTQTDITIHEIGPNPDPIDPRKKSSPLPTLRRTFATVLDDQNLSGVPQIDRYC